MRLSPEDEAALGYAKALLEHPGLAAQVAGIIGMPIEKALALLPERWAAIVGNATRRSLETALKLALTTLDGRSSAQSRNVGHKIAVAVTGAGGGALGLAGLPLELPVSTTLMLRSIADVARSEGERLETADARIACLEVFALGGTTSIDDASESAYFAVRATLARAVNEAAVYVAQRGISKEGAPVLVRLVGQIASRFSGTVSQKVAAQAVPLLGAAGGSAVNVLFMNHFQQVARGHFIVRRLERVYGAELVRSVYDRL